MNNVAKCLQGMALAVVLVWAPSVLAEEAIASGLEIRATVASQYAVMNVPPPADSDDLPTKMARDLSGGTAESRYHIQISGDRFLVRKEVEFSDSEGEVTQEYRDIVSYDGQLLRTAHFGPNKVPSYREMIVANSDSGQAALEEVIDRSLVGALSHYWKDFACSNHTTKAAQAWQVEETETAFQIRGEASFDLPKRYERPGQPVSETTTFETVSVLDEALPIERLTWEGLGLEPEKGVLMMHDADGVMETRVPDPQYLASGYVNDQNPY